MFCGSNVQIDQIDEVTIFQRLPKYDKNFKNFLEKIQFNLGIMFLFDDSKMEEISFMNLFVEKISKIDFIVEILRENCIITSIGVNTNQGKAVKKRKFVKNFIFFKCL